MFHCEHQLDASIFQLPKPYDYVAPSYLYDFRLDYGVSLYSCPLNQIFFECISDPSLHPLMINPYL